MEELIAWLNRTLTGGHFAHCVKINMGLDGKHTNLDPEEFQAAAVTAYPRRAFLTAMDF